MVEGGDRDARVEVKRNKLAPLRRGIRGRTLCRSVLEVWEAANGTM